MAVAAKKAPPKKPVAPDVASSAPISLDRVMTLVRQHQTLSAKIATAEAQLKQLVDKRREVEEQTLPGLMGTLELDRLTLKDGTILEVKHIVSASLSEDRKPKAFAWLRTNGYGSLIKYEVSASFGKGQEKEAAKVAAGLRKRWPDIPVNDKLTVHANTLKAFVREAMEEGLNLPLELFGVFITTKAEFKLPKQATVQSSPEE